jgi:Flp pilus assembly protein TadD
MIELNKASSGAIALALGGLAVLCAAQGPDGVSSVAAKADRKAAAALGRHRPDEAIVAAEQAVAAAPREAGFRMTLGQSYLAAGRFAAARQAFADVVALDARNGKAALDLALTQTALGDWQAARATLTAHADAIPVGDRGLALALTGDSQGAVVLLTEAARQPGANATVRQNLALAYAMGGQWQLARVVAAADLSPADVDGRLQQWAAFVQPHAAADQVATLLGVTPAADAGEPAALALVQPAQPAPIAVAVAAPASVVTTPPTVAPAMTAAAEPVTTVAAVAASHVVFAPRREVVQALPAFTIQEAMAAYKTPVAHGRIAAAPVRVAATHPLATKPATGGGWYIQLGAYANMAVAKDNWVRASRRVHGLSGHQAQGVSVKTASATLFRLSVGGFSRAGAVDLCRQYRARGGDCFVRAAAGDQLARWDKPAAVQVASR